MIVGLPSKRASARAVKDSRISRLAVYFRDGGMSYVVRLAVQKSSDKGKGKIEREKRRKGRRQNPEGKS